MRYDIRIIDIGLHLAMVRILFSPFAILPDFPLLFLIGEKRWINDYDWRIRACRILHHWLSLVVIYFLFGERAALAWLSHLLIDQITH